jgi:hypothetical protein
MARLTARSVFRPRLLLAPTAAALVATTLLSGCGGAAKAAGPAAPTLPPVLQGDPTQVVAAAAGRTLSEKNAGVTVSVPVFQEGQLANVNGEGALDFTASRMKLIVPNAQRAEERQFGRKLYVLLPEQAGPALGGKKWVSVDLDAAQSKSPDPFNLYAFDPKQIVATATTIRDAKLLGQEPVRDANTTHFAGVIDPARLGSAGLEPAFAAQFRKATNGRPTPADVWLDDTGLVRRMTITLAPPDAALPPGSNPLATVELFDFGTADVSFTEPAASEVADQSDLGGLSGNGD